MSIFHWLNLRVAALIVVAGTLFDVEIILLIFGFLVLHVSMGLKAIVYDYIHLKKVKLISLILIRISAIEIIRYALELFT
uniref:Succinate:cytochrome c oxidoreductase subunit 4 n=1 Tax=Mastocarpus papillatus TaxID=31436 RepID=A0A342RZ73_9FLOR|nr:succinate:cytochrome c oxidoreductase subunit 4 [Mastocarpus papillatus]AOL58019.1 succinate:cytochrome c oxidoreductase subunit 4 [Mastocarpus papillatus]